MESTFLTLVYRFLQGLVPAHFSASSLSTSPFSIMLQSYSFCQIFLNNVPQDPSPEFFHAACLLFLPFLSS